MNLDTKNSRHKTVLHFLHQNLKAAMAAEKTKGFSHVVVASNLRDGFSLLIQSAGLGGMKHNAVLMAWPAGWKLAQDSSARQNFIGETI